MSEATKTNPETEIEDNESKFRKAVRWATDESMKNHQGLCGICSWKPWSYGSAKETKNSMRQHIQRRHKNSIVELYDHGVLDLRSIQPAPPSKSSDELLATAGVSDVEELDRYNYLEVPTEISRRLEEDGSTGRWVRQDRIDHFKRQGAKVVGLNGTKGGAKQPSTEDNTMRTNELVYMEIPHELAGKRQKLKESRIVEQLNSRAEEVREAQDEYTKRTVDYLVRERNLDMNRAKQVARALASRRESEEAAQGPGMMIKDRHGSQNI